MLYEALGHPLARPKPLTLEEAKAEAESYYDQWFLPLRDAIEVAQFCRTSGKPRDAAFMLHQAVERAYHCVLLVLTLYSPKSHRITMLRSQAKGRPPESHLVI